MNSSPLIGYAQVNGLRMYYEVHGTGRPLVLIHGSFSTVAQSFGELLPQLAATRQVIAVELQAHGHTTDNDRPLRYETLADDIAALLAALSIVQADVFGFSLGGSVALQTALRYSALVRRLVVVSAPPRSHDRYPEVLAAIRGLRADALVGSPLHQAYVRAAPQPSQWGELVRKLQVLLTTDPYDWTQQITESLRAPTLLVAGDADIFSPASAVELFHLLGGGQSDSVQGAISRSQLAILPGTTHTTMLGRSELLVALVTKFLDA